ncbi:MAG: hypothetical protein QOI80_1117 [Solirubrobacteraceae bacterium]|nr:hypothetical protein [Solirubrobacteraceae bacterium]
MTTTLTQTNEQTALRAIALIAGNDRGPAAEEIIHPEFTGHRLGVTGVDGFREMVRMVNTTFADITITPLDVIATEDKVVVRTRFAALHVGVLKGTFAASDRTVEAGQIHIWELEDGRIRDHWLCMDEFDVLRQIGAV